MCFHNIPWSLIGEGEERKIAHVLAFHPVSWLVIQIIVTARLLHDDIAKRHRTEKIESTYCPIVV